MQQQKIDFQAISARTDFLTGQYAMGSMQTVHMITAKAVKDLVRTHHPASRRLTKVPTTLVQQ